MSDRDRVDHLCNMRRKEAELAHDDLTRALHYDSDTGHFHWAVGTRRAGKRAGRLSQQGYWTLNYLRNDYRVHRLAWFYVNGQWPVHFIDHINGDRQDNRISNLRDVTQRVNLQNIRTAPKKSKTGLLGVSCMESGNFLARIKVNGEIRHIGTFSTPEEAHHAYIAAKRLLHEGCTI